MFSVDHTIKCKKNGTSCENCLAITQIAVYLGQDKALQNQTFCEMVWACVKEGWWACFEKSIILWSEGQEEARTTKDNMEDASGEGGYALNRARWRVGVGEIAVRVG